VHLKDLNYIVLLFTDFLGYLKGRTIPVKELDMAVSQGVGFDGSSIPACVKIEESDMVMKPDPATIAVLPRYFYDRGVATLICDIYGPSGERFEGDPRYICQRVEEKLRADGYAPNAAAELEFYLATRSEKGELLSLNTT